MHFLVATNFCKNEIFETKSFYFICFNLLGFTVIKIIIIESFKIKIMKLDLNANNLLDAFSFLSIIFYIGDVS